MFIPCKPFQLSLIFTSKAGAYPWVEGEPETWAGSSLTCKHKPYCNGLPGTNTLAYYKRSLIMDVKSFITLGPVPMLWNFYVHNLQNFVTSKSVCLSQAFPA